MENKTVIRNFIKWVLQLVEKGDFKPIWLQQQFSNLKILCKVVCDLLYSETDI